MKLIVGLGNPGLRYAQTRHNVGFMMVDLLGSLYSAEKEKKQGQALVRVAQAGPVQLLLVKPQSFMNLSGDPLWEIIRFYKGRVEDFIIVHDDLDLPLGRMRFKDGGGSGGHRGLKSITERLGSEEYDRLKIGIGRPPTPTPAEAYVLQAFSDEEKGVLDRILAKGAEGLKVWMNEGCVPAMNAFNATDLRPAPAEQEKQEKQEE